MIPRLDIQAPFTVGVTLTVQCWACGAKASMADAVFIVGGTGCSFDLPRDWRLLGPGMPICPLHEIVVRDRQP